MIIVTKSRLTRRFWVESDLLLFLFIAILVFFSRLPFLDAGYGDDPDAWRVAGAARSIAASGEYSASRFPGYPLQELFYSIIWRGGPWALNGTTALLSALGAAFFALSVKALGSKDYVLASLALAFTPVVFVNSTNSMDYVWALAFILGSLYFTLLRRPLLAGVFLGVAIGYRITSGAMLIPLSLLLIKKGRKNIFWNILKFSLGACFIAAAAFIPVVLRYGWGFFKFYERGYPPLIEVVKGATEWVWGRIGLLAMVIAVISLIFRTRKSRENNSIPTSVAGIQITAWVGAVGIYLIAFLRLPHAPGYLIPAVPFAILLLGRVLNRRLFIFVCIALICSSFIGFGRSGIYGGPIFYDHAKRIEDMNFTEQVVSRADSLPNKSVIMVGWWLPQIRIISSSQSKKGVGDNLFPPDHILNNTPFRLGRAEYVYSLDERQLEKYSSQDFQLYYLPGMREYSLKVYGYDLREKGALPLVRDNMS